MDAQVTSVQKDTPTWSCSNCRDAGFSSGSISYQAYGTSDKYFCNECAKGRQMLEEWRKEPAQQENFRQWKQEKIARSMRLSGVGNHFKDKKLSDLKVNDKLYKECLRYVENWQEMKIKDSDSSFGEISELEKHTQLLHWRTISCRKSSLKFCFSICLPPSHE